MLDGVCWAVLRPLGNRRRHFAVPDGQLEALIRGEVAPTGIESFLDAIENNLITQPVAAMVPGRKQPYLAWQVALAWLTRDQECRFDHVLDWRSVQSDSDSPARGLNQTEKLEALRALISAMALREQSLRRKIASLEQEKTRSEQDAAYRYWEIQRLRIFVSEQLEVVDEELIQGDLGLAVLRDLAQQRLAKACGDAGSGDIRLIEAKNTFEAARQSMVELEKEEEQLKTQIDILPRVIAHIEAEYPSSQYALEEAESFPCPICEVPVDRVLAEKCSLSHKLPDLETCRKRLKSNRENFQRETEQLKSAKQKFDLLKPKLVLAKQKVNNAEKQYKQLEELRTGREQLSYDAQRLVDEVERLSKLMHEQQLASEKAQQASDDLNGKRQDVLKHINQQSHALSELNEKFNAIIRILLSDDASGEIRLTGNGLKLTVQMGGNRSTSAIDSLKVVAFDLAVMCLSMENKTNIPAFLVHDSPREADLGLSLYHRLFDLVFQLEQVGPAFQYIITTTTRPPDNMAMDPWLVLTLSGYPAGKRLLKCDLSS
ncbi:chromosome segregation protein SMC [Halomonas sp. ALS9]|nr:chromosome segregation protein SMC [Halomonas sp. ALS9]